MPHPALSKFAEERAQSVQNRIADWITGFAGSMVFVYVHIAWFAVWILVGVEGYPYGLLTMIVSLEAIFLSTFVMISQNRARSAKREVRDAVPPSRRHYIESSRSEDELLRTDASLLASADAADPRPLAAGSTACRSRRSSSSPTSALRRRSRLLAVRRRRQVTGGQRSVLGSTMGGR